MAYIEAENLQKTFKVYERPKGAGAALRSLIHRTYTEKRAVDGISFSIQKGEMVGYIGPNGAGKSTTIKMLGGILVPDGGRVLCGDRVPWKERKENALHMGVVFGQGAQLNWELPMEDTFELYRKMYRIPESIYKRNVECFTELLGMGEFLRKPVRSLSLGQKMRAERSAVLLHDPEVLFLYEPTVGLDVVAKDRIRKFLKELNREKQTTILLTTHDLSDIEQLCDRIFMIDKGQEIFDGTVSQLKETFGKMKTLSFDLTPGQNHLVSHYEGLPDMSIDRQGNTLNIEFDSSRYQSADIIKQTLSDFEVRDLKMVDTDIEDIIRRFYRKEL